eukprot:5471490-Karenia_brevis.AAC.1
MMRSWIRHVWFATCSFQQARMACHVPVHHHCTGTPSDAKQKDLHVLVDHGNDDDDDDDDDD